MSTPEIKDGDRWPETPQDIKNMMGGSFSSAKFVNFGEGPFHAFPADAMDRYTVTAHDLLEAMSNWREYIAPTLGESAEARPTDGKTSAVDSLLSSHRRLSQALRRMLASDIEIATATEDQLCAAANEPGDAELNEQAAAVLEARAALANIPEELK